MRVTGSASLKMSLRSLDDVNVSDLVPFTLAATTNIEPTQLANVSEQRCLLKVGTTEIGEYFNISKIVIFVKPVATQLPG